MTPFPPYGFATRTDRLLMHKAIKLARAAEENSDKPFGCVITRGSDELAHGAGTGPDHDPLRHSECMAITEACRITGGLLSGCTLYSTHEPCAMCCGAIRHSKISRVVFGSWRSDLPELFRRCRYGAVELLNDTSIPPTVVPGVLREACVNLWPDSERNWGGAT